MRRRGYLLLGLMLLYAVPYFIAFSHPTYHFPIEPLMMAMCGTFFAMLVHDRQNLFAALKQHRMAMIFGLAAFFLAQAEFAFMMSDRL